MKIFTVFQSGKIFNIRLICSEPIEIIQILGIDATFWFIDNIPYCSVQIRVRKYNCLLVSVHIASLQLILS